MSTYRQLNDGAVESANENIKPKVCNVPVVLTSVLACVLLMLSIFGVAHAADIGKRECHGGRCFLSPAGPLENRCNVTFFDQPHDHCMAMAPCTAYGMQDDCYYTPDDRTQCYQFGCWHSGAFQAFMLCGGLGIIFSVVGLFGIIFYIFLKHYRPQIKE
jgi:hypothetical protein